MGLARAFLAAFLAAAMPAAAAAGDPEGFIEPLGDVPLMPGLDVAEGQGMSFDAPGGRVVEVVAAGAMAPSEVRKFYDATLPQLGWVGAVPEFQREGEALEIKLTERGGGTAVTFFLKPAR